MIRTRVAVVGAGPHALTTCVYLVRAGVRPDDLLAIDSDETHVNALADYLMDCEERGLLVYETGRQETGPVG